MYHSRDEATEITETETEAWECHYKRRCRQHNLYSLSTFFFFFFAHPSLAFDLVTRPLWPSCLRMVRAYLSAAIEQALRLTRENNNKNNKTKTTKRKTSLRQSAPLWCEHIKGWKEGLFIMTQTHNQRLFSMTQTHNQRVFIMTQTHNQRLFIMTDT